MTTPYTLLKAWNLRARKELGQNFLKESSLAAKIVELACIGADDVVLEIGAGLGAMTLPAAGKAGELIAVEKDKHLLPLLRNELLTQGLDKVRVIDGDILKLDLTDIAQEHGKMLTVIGNLPYNISSQVLLKLVDARSLIKRAVLMFQTELADRLRAEPGSRTYGRLSVLLQYCADIKVLKQVKAEMFFPKPKVGSTVLGIEFKTHIDPMVGDEKLFRQVIQAAFGQRRKTLRNALSGQILNIGADGAQTVLGHAGIDPRRRAETLSVAEFVKLTDIVKMHLDDQAA